MVKRLVRVSSVSGGRLVIPTLALLVSATVVGATPGLLGDLDRTRRYMSPVAKQVFIVVGSAAAVGVCLVLLVQIAVAGRLLGVLYAVQRGARTWIVTPAGLVGSRRGRLELREGVVSIRLVMQGSPQAPARTNFTHHLYVSQEVGGRTLHAASMGVLRQESLEPLVRWLDQRGLSVSVTWSSEQTAQL